MIIRLSKVLFTGIFNILLSILFLIMVVVVYVYWIYIFLYLLFSFKRYIKYFDMTSLCFYYDKISNIHIICRPNKKSLIHDDTNRLRSIIEILDYIIDKDKDKKFFTFRFNDYLYNFKDLPNEAKFAIKKRDSKLYKELLK